jgi:hypothetical protein
MPDRIFSHEASRSTPSRCIRQAAVIATLFAPPAARGAEDDVPRV